MSGKNRFAPGIRAPLGRESGSLSGAPVGTCVFISHKREDSALAEAAAEVLMAMNIDAWLDLNELAASAPSNATEHLRLTEAIETGLQNSSHLLALITQKTKSSWWVPFEIGSSRALRKEIAFLLHRDVPDLPSYCVVGEWLVDQHSFYE